ncbi:hypothetical protein K2173_011724 [Erythroxylum novogranatense]|uniref:CUE domain-containing protein n=1 Tax=Erythroxylum novogranatense TaxID=1862640 RepID=A0AAV8TKG1_9ROSI|nr:hypothetical protein K2173_011724 [Erythroxylum novogranatense]
MGVFDIQQKTNLLIGRNYELALNQALQNVMAEIHEGTPNLPQFIHVFFELMQAKVDPPLETIWVYCALSFTTRKITAENLLDRISISKQLFQLISGCAGACGGSKSIALLAPVVFEMYKLIVDLLREDLGSKRVKKAIKQVKSLIGVILGYITACCKELNQQRDSNLIASFADLVGLWMHGNENENSFLPLAGSEVYRDIDLGNRSVNYLCGIVIAEVLLLKLCLHLRVENQGVELEKELRSCLVGSVTAFQSIYFYDTLLRMLLQGNLPVTSLLGSGEEVLLKTIMYDALLLAEYSFLSPNRATADVPAGYERSLALTRLITTHEAIEFFRNAGDQKRARAYSSSFSISQLPSEIIKLVTDQIGTVEAARKLNRSSPKALITGLLVLEGQGVRIFNDSISKYRAKLALNDYKADYEQPSFRSESKEGDADTLFYIDNTGEEEENKETKESMNAAFVAAASTIRMSKIRKRERKGYHTERKRTKFFNHELADESDSDRERSSSIDEGSSSRESEFENPISDEDDCKGSAISGEII